MTVKDIRNYLSYDPETGVFRWIKRPAYCVQVGAVAGIDEGRGYYVLQFNKSRYYCHRLAFILMGVELSDDEVVDHINLNKSDNRWVNLRKATYAQNAMNRPKLTNNVSGHTGVCWDKKMMKWKVYCQHKHFGYFESLDLAKEKYQEVSKESYKEYHLDSTNANT